MWVKVKGKFDGVGGVRQDRWEYHNQDPQSIWDGQWTSVTEKDILDSDVAKVSPSGPTNLGERLKDMLSSKDSKVESSGSPTSKELTENPWKKRPDHYGTKGEPDLAQFLIRSRTGFVEGNVMKYVHRWKDKDGLADLRKAKHYIDMLIWEAEHDNSTD